MKVLCWNVAGIRACIKKKALDFLSTGEYDIVCFQETKAEEAQVTVPPELAAVYPHRYWRSTEGTTQRKGLSGTAIWSKQPALEVCQPLAIDSEGRVIALEFDEWILVTVYTPNSQGPLTERNIFRVCIWDEHFREYVSSLNAKKPTVICGDFNVAHQDIDIYKPNELRNSCAGFLDSEREQFQNLLDAGWSDALRMFHPTEERKFTFWNQIRPHLRRSNKGWRIDYFLIPDSIPGEKIKGCEILPDVMGSDHCPITLDFQCENSVTS